MHSTYQKSPKRFHGGGGKGLNANITSVLSQRFLYRPNMALNTGDSLLERFAPPSLVPQVRKTVLAYVPKGAPPPKRAQLTPPPPPPPPNPTETDP